MPKTQISISVITPVFNNEKFIQQCIENVIQQKCTRSEHIIIDGASTDGTADIIRTYAKSHPHIRWRSEPDLGQSDAINKGIKLANGQVISILNVDDYYEPGALDFISTVINNSINPQHFFLIGNCQVFDSKDKHKAINRPKDITLINILTGRCEHPCNPSAYFYSRSIHEELGDYDIKDHYTMDLDFICRVLSVHKITYIDKVLGNFRERKGSKTQKSKSDGKHFDRKNRVLRKAWNNLSLSMKMRVAIIKSMSHACRLLKKIRNKTLYEERFRKLFTRS